MRYTAAIVWLVTLALAGRASGQDDPLGLLLDRAVSLERDGHYPEAWNLYREAMRTAETSADPRLVRALSGMGDTEDEQGHYQDAEREYRRALSLVEAAQGKRSAAYAAVAVNLGEHYYEMGQMAQAAAMLRDSVAVLATYLPGRDGRLAMARNCLALVEMGSHHYGEAERLLEQARDALDNQTGAAVYQAVTWTNLGALRRLQGRNEEATRLFEQAINMIGNTFNDDHPMLVRPLNNLGLVDVVLGDRNGAEAAFRRALAVAEKRLGREHPLYGRVLLNYAYAERKFGNRKEARALTSQANALLRETARSNGMGMTVDASAFQRRR